MGQFLHFLGRQAGFDDFLDAAGAHHAGDAERDIRQAVFAFERGGDGHDAAFVAEDGADDLGQGHGHAEAGGALVADDVVGRAADLFEDLGAAVDEIALAADRAVVVHGQAAHVRERPGREFAVAVLAEDGGVDVHGGDAAVFGEEPAEARGIQHGAGAEDAAARPVGLDAGEVGQDVDRVGDDQHDGIGIDRLHVGDDGGDDLGVDLQQVEPVLAGARLGLAGGDHDDGRLAVGLGATSPAWMATLG
jgi:hypothetical protein